MNVLKNFLKPNEHQKKQTGEVYTPPDLINEMLDKLEEYNPGVFSNPDLTWYDNSCGIGNFLVLVYLRLDKGLETVIKDPLERKNHILNRMIYGVDICPLNVSVCKFLLGIDYQTNIICGDGLSQETHKGMTFDVIVGNPPYNKDSVNKGTGHTLWDKFVIHNLKILKTKGYLLYIHPSLWRKYGNKTGKEILKNQLLYLSIHDQKDGIKTFSCGTRYDWYILKKESVFTSTIINNQKKQIEIANLKNKEMIPNFNLEYI